MRKHAAHDMAIGTSLEILKQAIRRSGMSYRELASITDTSPALLCRIVNGTREGISLERTERILQALGYRLEITRKGPNDG